MSASRRIEGLSARLSRARGGRRWLHPTGDGYRAVLEVPGGAETGNALFDTPGVHAAVARLSRAVGTPSRLPDAYGLAFTLPELGQDVLVTTSVDVPVLHHLPLPAPGGPWSQPYSSALAFRLGESACILGAKPLEAERAFAICIARPFGRFLEVARLRLGDRLPDPETEALTFDVWNHGAGLVPVGPFQGVRRPVYRGSRAGRGS